MSDCINTDDNDFPGYTEVDPAEIICTVVMMADQLIGGAAVVIVGSALLLGLSSRYPATINYFRDITYVEATEMTAADGGAATVARDVANVWDSPEMPRRNIIEKILGVNLKVPSG